MKLNFNHKQRTLQELPQTIHSLRQHLSKKFKKDLTKLNL